MKKMTMTTTLLPALLALLAVATSCCEKTLYTHEQLYGSPVTLTADWQGHTPTADALEVEAVSLTEDIDHSETLTLPANGTVQATLPEALYRLTATHPAANLDFDGEAFRLTPAADGTLPEPGALSAARIEAQLTAQQNTPVSLPLLPMTRTLVLRFRLGADRADEVAGMELRLSGMASAIAINGYDRSVGTEGAIAPLLQPDEAVDDGVAYAATVRTLGTQPGTRQVARITVRLADGSAFTTEADVTDCLAPLNSQGTGSGYVAEFGLLAAGKPGDDLHFTLLPWEDAGGDSDGDAGMVIPDE